MRDKIINAVIEVVEDGLRKGAPDDIDKSEIERVIMLGRPSLKDTAEKIADKALEDVE